MNRSIRTALTTTVLAAVAATTVATTAGTASATTAPTRPAVAFAGTTCAKTSATTWTVTMRWTARNARYTDLGSNARPAQAKVLQAQNRTWLKTVRVHAFPGVTGTPVAPTSVTGRYSQSIAPYAFVADYRQITVLDGPYTTARTACPA